jgi:hypothetical protein
MGQAVWEERIMGADIFEIAQKLGISVEQVSDLLMEHHRQRQAQPVEAKSFYRDLAVSRVDALLRVYLPIAVMNSVIVEKVHCGEWVSEESLEHPLHCGVFCLALLKFQSELLGLKVQEPNNAGASGERRSLDWLKTQMQFVQELVNAAPRDVLDLPEEPNDSADLQQLEQSAQTVALEELLLSGVAGDDDLAGADLREILLMPKKVSAPPVDRILQEPAEPSHATNCPAPGKKSLAAAAPSESIEYQERRRRFFMGESDGL